MITPVGDLFDKNAYSTSNVDIYEHKTGFTDLQKSYVIPANKYIGIFYSWHVENNKVFLGFYRSIADYNAFRNPIYIRYEDYKKLNFPTVPTWTGSGIDFSAVSTYVQNLVKQWELESQSGIESTIKKYLPIFIGGIAAVIFLPSIIKAFRK